MFIYEPQFIEDSVVSKFDAVVQVIDGEGYFMIGGEEHEVIEGQMIIT
jgi:quercetin dioxygenase-like cupin family protein